MTVFPKQSAVFFTVYVQAALNELTLSKKCSKEKFKKSIDTKLTLWDSPFTHGNIYT